MKVQILACSDIHDAFERFPVDRFLQADLCVVAGDLTNLGVRGNRRRAPEPPPVRSPGAQRGGLWPSEEIARAAEWLQQLARRFPVFWIPGNHDIGVGNDTFGDLENCCGVLDRTVQAGPLRLHGVSMAPCYDAPFLAEEWDYMTADEAVETAHYQFEAVDLVISHAPPYGCCDMAGPIMGAGGDRHIGSRALLRYIHRHAPRIVVCGHVHEARGQDEIETSLGITTVYNLAHTWQRIDIDLP